MSVVRRLRKDSERRWSPMGREVKWTDTLEEDRAVKMGCEMLGEAIVWGVGLGILAWQMAEDDRLVCCVLCICVLE